MTHSRGYTVLETIVVIAFTAIILAAIAYFFSNFNGLYSASQGSGSTSALTNRLFSQLHDDIVSANRVSASHTFSQGTFVSGTSTLVLELPSVDTSGNRISGTYDYIAFYKSGATVYRVLVAGTGSTRMPGQKILDTAVQALTFAYNTGMVTLSNKVDVYATSTASTKRGTVTEYRHAQVYLRNF